MMTPDAHADILTILDDVDSNVQEGKQANKSEIATGARIVIDSRDETCL